MSQVQVKQTGAIGELILCSAKTLNALTHEDIKTLTAGLARHESDPSIRAIIIRSDSNKAFCAGGDMKQIREYIIANQFNKIHDFFTDEYALNLAISRCKKPYIALMHGIAMGGGLGVSIHGSARVVTETSVLAMPETRIGFFPDVGASHFLPGLARRSGYWLGLTAVPIKGYQAVSVGLATHYVNSKRLEKLQADLNTALQSDNGNSADKWHQTVGNTLDAFSTELHDEKFDDTLRQREAWFADDDLSAIQQRLRSDTQRGNEDAKYILELLDAGSPYAARITVQLLRDAANKDLQACLELELALGAEAIKHPDCAEGIRAVLVDKDRHPVWQDTRACQ